MFRRVGEGGGDLLISNRRRRKLTIDSSHQIETVYYLGSVFERFGNRIMKRVRRALKAFFFIMGKKGSKESLP